MAIFTSYLRIILLIIGVLAGIQLPGFVDQYGKSLQAHLIESDRSLDEFRDEAERFFDGSIEELIAHYQASDDKVFQEGGQSIGAIYQRNQQLKQAYTDFSKHAWNAYQQAFFTPVDDIQREVRASFSYTVKLNPGAILFGLVSGLLLAIFGELIVRLMVKPFRQSSRS
ncbi:DUF2937 family protein [Idiomarina ramblicola]|uniref:DUF2937 domain-containing protein n=1 Tax=Idiomarina ramblicola TaxID=263724 RepID=A0A432Z5R5_9GAMM|nr:DUF2937 family protein [Idiomarina ramblicola]RUO73234.1 DUF2937 domain-containing protein [Idiomarina ramblicola]